MMQRPTLSSHERQPTPSSRLIRTGRVGALSVGVAALLAACSSSDSADDIGTPDTDRDDAGVVDPGRTDTDGGTTDGASGSHTFFLAKKIPGGQHLFVDPNAAGEMAFVAGIRPQASVDIGGDPLPPPEWKEQEVVALAKLERTGKPLWVKRLSGAAALDLATVHFNSKGHVVTVLTRSATVPDQTPPPTDLGAGPLPPNGTGGRSMCVLTYDAAGAYVRSRCIDPGKAHVSLRPWASTITPDDGIVIVGDFDAYSYDDKVSFDGTVLACNTGCTFMVKLDESGAVQWAKTYDGSYVPPGGVFRFGSSFAEAVDSDAAGHVYVQGRFQDRLTLGSSSFDMGSEWGRYLAQIDQATGAILWATSFGKGEKGFGMGMLGVEKGGGGVVIHGVGTKGSDLGDGPYTGDEAFAFVARLSPSGELLWKKQFVGKKGDCRIAADFVGSDVAVVVSGAPDGAPLDFGAPTAPGYVQLVRLDSMTGAPRWSDGLFEKAPNDTLIVRSGTSDGVVMFASMYQDVEIGPLSVPLAPDSFNTPIITGFTPH